MHTDLTFFTNEPDRNLYDRFSNILKSNTQFFDVLVGYFRTSGFFKMYEAMADVEKIRILVGLNVDKYTVKIIDKANNEIAFDKLTTKEAKEAFDENIVDEFECCQRDDRQIDYEDIEDAAESLIHNIPWAGFFEK